MDMDAMEELMGSKDRAMIVKGRRSKRPRQSSPAFSAVVTTSDDGSGGGGGEDGGGGEINSLIPSVSICSEISTSTEEDEDMANCLILLAQSGCQRQVDQEEVKVEKICSRKFTEMATTTTVKAGIYVYECKTCNRTFPSFQALGGHRASHKKPKQMVEEKKAPITSSNDHHEEKQQEEKQFTKLISPPLSSSHGVNKAKIHECSICGLEFSSGQALGGHMRRHRTPASSTKVTMSIDTTTTESSHDGERPRNILQLDLNLPAPEDDHHDSKFQFSANKQHLFSSPALVDCHY